MKYLFGIPGAGAGPREFIDWQNMLGNDIIFKQISYQKGFAAPGDFYDTMDQVARVTAEEVLSSVEEDDEIYLFGHCMGASVAYETASLLKREKGIDIKALFFAAFISPDVPILDGISHLDDDLFIEEIHSHGTFPEEFFVNKSLTKMFLPRIKADYRMIEGYCDKRHEVLNCPIVGIFGEDDEMVVPSETEGWSKYTSVKYISKSFPGDHYFYYDSQKEIVELIKKYIEEID